MPDADNPDRPLISVVTVAFNSAATIASTLESVRAQTYKNIEHIVVDGGSTDGTRQLLEAAGDSIRWQSEPDKGIYDAMNKGVQMARGKWIHLLNSDDYYAGPDVLGKIVRTLDERKLNYCDIIRAYPDGSEIVQSYRFRKLPLYLSAYLPHPALIVSRTQYDAIGEYDTSFRIAADHDLILRMVERYPANHIPVVLTIMRQEGVSTTNLDVSRNEFTQILRKHGLFPPMVAAIAAFRHIWWRLRAKKP